jgi:V8-like Glu-specific endopeptidase
VALGMAVAALCFFNNSNAGADVLTERLQDLQRSARAQIAAPLRKAPFNCDDSGWELKDLYVVDIAGWVQAAGLQRGDRLLTFGGLSLTQAGAVGAWAQVPRSEHVHIRVERNGKEVSILLPCRDHSKAWQAEIDFMRAFIEDRWTDCIERTRRYNQLVGIASSNNQYLILLCVRGKGQATKQPLSGEFWLLVHNWATKAIEESRYHPAGLTAVRGSLLDAAEHLERAGRKSLADDVKQQITAFSRAPASVGVPAVRLSQRVGTGFAIRPDGFLLTAFHVVKNATEIDVSCPEVLRATAQVDQFSESNDLAVLRLTDVKTPTYLSLAELKSTTIGEQVFTVGYPAPNLLGGEAKFTEGAISSLSVGGDSGYMQISVPVQPGNSGGALVNRSGEVVGIVIASASALGFLKDTPFSECSSST